MLTLRSILTGFGEMGVRRWEMGDGRWEDKWSFNPKSCLDPNTCGGNLRVIWVAKSKIQNIFNLIYDLIEINLKRDRL